MSLLTVLNIIYVNILWNKLISKLIKCVLVNSDKVTNNLSPTYTKIIR